MDKKQELTSMLTALISGDEQKASEHFSSYINQKSTEIFKGAKKAEQTKVDDAVEKED